MPLSGEYIPSTSEWARNQAEQFEASGGTEANTMRGVPIIVLTTVGSTSGGLRKTALMRVEHDGRYAVVASKGGAPDEPRWAANMRAHAHVELQDGADKRERQRVREVGDAERHAVFTARGHPVHGGAVRIRGSWRATVRGERRG